MKRKVTKKRQKDMDACAPFNTLTNLVYTLCRYEQVMRLGVN